MIERVVNIARALEALARSQPNAPAMYAPGRPTLSYADLGAHIHYVRKRLGDWNIGECDVVAGVIPLRPEMALACAAVPGAATFAPLSPMLTSAFYCELLERLRPKALIVPKALDHPVRIAARRCRVTEIDIVPDPLAPAGAFTLELAGQWKSPKHTAPSRPDWAYLLNTSGTTGRSKLVPRSHPQFALHAQLMGQCCRLAANDVGCHLLPMYHGQGLDTALMVPLLHGASVVCLPETDMDAFFAALTEYRLTWITAGPTVYREILRRAHEFPDGVANHRLRSMRVGAGRLHPIEIETIETIFGVPLVTGLGTTEVYTITHEAVLPRARKLGSVGRALNNEVGILTATGVHTTTAEAGEIVVRGPLVFDGYFDDAEATAAAFIDGWFRTGDVGCFDADGYLFLQGRVNDIINRGGEKISPLELDAAIETIPGVRAAATFAIPHRSLGEEIAAAVVRDDNAAIEAADIVEQVRRRMGPKRVPRRIYFVESLPLTDSGKVRRFELPRLVGLDPSGMATAVEPLGDMSRSMPSPLESALIGLWSSVLRVSDVGVNDEFLSLGGSPASGARLLVSVKALFGVDLSNNALSGTAATVAGMAKTIEAARSANADTARR